MPKRIVVVASVKPFEVMTLVASALLGALYLCTFLVDPLGPRTIHALLPATACAWRVITINHDLKRVHQKLNM